MRPADRKNTVFYGFGTIGRDMFYGLESNALIYFLTNILDLPLRVYVATTIAFTILRIFDALNDPIMGWIIQNSKSKYGKFKPPMIIGALIGIGFYLILFSDFGLRNWLFVVIFSLAYLGFDVFIGLNDIAYWSMLPALSLDQKVREKIGAFARICANLGGFTITVAWQPVTEALGGNARAWFILALILCAVSLATQLVTWIGVKEPRFVAREKAEETINLRDLIKLLSKNDQLLWATLSMGLFTIGYLTTVAMAIYYMQYVYGDASLFPILAAALGVAQISALAVFPAISKRLRRAQLYKLGMVLVVAGYIIFLFFDHSIVAILAGGAVLFVGNAFVQLLMLMFLSDTIEYGEWKLGHRSESITLSAQPLINKMAGAIGAGVTSLAVVLSGIKTSDVAAVEISTGGQWVIKLMMLAVPMILAIAGYIIWRAKYTIDEDKYAQIVADLHARGDFVADLREEEQE